MTWAFIYLSVVSTLFVSHGNCASVKRDLKPITLRYTAREIIQEKCHSAYVIDEDIINKLNNATSEVIECITKVNKMSKLHTLADFDEGYFFDSAKPCLTKDEEYIPDFILSGLNTTLSNLCSPENTQRLNEIRATVQNYDNRLRINPNEVLSSCLKRPELFVNYAISANERIYRDDLCSDFQKLYKCFLHGMNKNTDNDYSEVVDVYLGGYLEECRRLYR